MELTVFSAQCQDALTVLIMESVWIVKDILSLRQHEESVLSLLITVLLQLKSKKSIWWFPALESTGSVLNAPTDISGMPTQGNVSPAKIILEIAYNAQVPLNVLTVTKVWDQMEILAPFQKFLTVSVLTQPTQLFVRSVL